MYLLVAIETFLVFPPLFIEIFIDPSASIASTSFASTASTTLHKRCSFGLRRPLYNWLAVLVEEVENVLLVLWIPVVTGGEIVL